MWTSTFLSHLSKVTSSTSKSSVPAVRYSAIPSDARGQPSPDAPMPNVFLDLDVEETITCFCRFDLKFFDALISRNLSVFD